MTKENAEIIAARNVEIDKILKVEEIIDGKQERINQLEKEFARKCDEVNLRKEVIDSMSDNLLKHEKENRELVSKLVMLKNQILENEIGQATERKFGAVKLFTGGSKRPPPLPVAVRNIGVSSCIVQNREGKERRLFPSH